MSMEKYGVEVEKPKNPELVKKASALHTCPHPAKEVKHDGDTSFCQQCGKYLKVGV